MVNGLQKKFSAFVSTSQSLLNRVPSPCNVFGLMNVLPPLGNGTRIDHPLQISAESEHIMLDRRTAQV